MFRRGELLAELFLQDLQPLFVAQPSGRDFGIDFFVGFTNARGGVNIVTVEVKATEELASPRFRLKKNQFALLANSNVPGLILVVDVKRRRYYFCIADAADAEAGAEFVSFPLTEVDDASRKALVDRLSG